MLITNHPTEKDSMSPFPFRKRAFTDTNKDGDEIIIGAGATTASVLKKIYDPHRISVINAEYPFLTRDNKERTYDPGKEDKFVFKNHASVDLFKSEAHRLIDIMTRIWSEMSLPLEKDKDRNITIPSTDKLMTELLKGNSKDLTDYCQKHYDTISLILSNIDIAKKFCIVRSVFPGWWLGSYAGKEEKDYEYFKESVELHAEVFRDLRNTDQFRRVRQQMFDEMGDPLISNVGYPIYKSGISAKTEILTLYQGTGLGYNTEYSAGSKWDDIRTNIYDKTPDRVIREFLFAVGVIRRQQYGYKWQHIMRQTEFGSVSVDDVRGFNTVRMAFLFPYIYNLYLTPYVADWNAFRFIIPGAYHNGVQKENRMKAIQNRKLYALEADYTNYDRFQLLDMMSKLTYLGYRDHPAIKTYILPMFMNTYRNIPLLLPDYNGSGKSVGIAMVSNKLGLLSGGKHTATNGTNHNSIINIAGFMNNGLMTRAQAKDYLLQYKGSNDDNIGKGDEWSHMQSDDTLLLDTSLQGVLRKGRAFKEAADRAGLKSSLGIGDRFLMRHTYQGKDTPVLARVWQNTLSNESAPDHELKFLIGLATRTEGLLGQKTVDPFSLGKLRHITVIEAYLTYEILYSLLKFVTTASVKSTNAVDYITLMVREAKHMSSGFDIKDTSTYFKLVQMSAETSNTLDRYRNAFSKALANYELEQMSKKEDSLSSYLLELKGQMNIPSVRFMIEQLSAMNADIATLMNKAEDREHSFFIKALETIGINKFF